MSSPTAPPNQPETEPTPIVGHDYDGIKEYDNPMPGWWIWIFWITVIFAVIYVPGVHMFGFIDTYEDDLDEAQAELIAVRDAFEEANPTVQVDEAYLATFVEDPAQLESGGAIFQTNCLPCHGPSGEGLIGPNLTDDYWIHGNSLEDMFQVVTNGVLEKGMTPWGSILSIDQRAQVVAFVRSLRGTNPPNAKAPQGELVGS